EQVPQPGNSKVPPGGDGDPRHRKAGDLVLKDAKRILEEAKKRLKETKNGRFLEEAGLTEQDLVDMEKQVNPDADAVTTPTGPTSQPSQGLREHKADPAKDPRGPGYKAGSPPPGFQDAVRNATKQPIKAAPSRPN